jgi:hypothetical protein
MFLACANSPGVAPTESSAEQRNAQEMPQRWTFHSDSAPFRVHVPHSCRRTKDLNEHAQLQLECDNDTRFIVIAQNLPADLPEITSRVMRRTGTKLLRSRLRDFAIGATHINKVGGVRAETVLSQGKADSGRVIYVNTYVVHAGWAYQIVGWGPPNEASLLYDQNDALLGGWEFVDARPPA